jgi:hypothetical protein
MRPQVGDTRFIEAEERARLREEVNHLRFQLARLHQAWGRAEKAEAVLEKIVDPSYVGNYSTPQVVEIYRTWARDALTTATEPH